jgi:hypothetical protein
MTPQCLGEALTSKRHMWRNKRETMAAGEVLYEHLDMTMAC